MKVKVAATTIAGATMLAVKSDIIWIALIVLLLILVVVVLAVHSNDSSKREAALEVLRILLGRWRG